MVRRIALLIGNNSYDDNVLARLSAPWEDVVTLKDALESYGAFETRVLFNAGLVDARSSISELYAYSGPDDLLLLYYTGHGLRDSSSGRLYFALPQTNLAKLRATALEASFVRGEADQSNSLRQVMILDCCHSGAIVEPGTKNAKNNQGLIRTDLDSGGHGRFTLAACSADQSAFEREGRSLFTRHLVDGITNGTAAPDKKDVSITDLHTYLCRVVAAENAPMQPLLWVDQGTAPLVIARNPKPRKPIDAELVSLLRDPDPNQALGAAHRLISIYQGQNPQQAADAETELQQRLAEADTLPLLVARPILEALEGYTPSERMRARRSSEKSDSPAREHDVTGFSEVRENVTVTTSLDDDSLYKIGDIGPKHAPRAD